MAGWGDLSSAQAMRDALDRIVEDKVNDIRPNKRPGTVLRVFKSGPTFNVSAEGSSPDPAAPPPVSLGNPLQVYYADVRLDTGDTVRARVQQDVPYARDAAWWDGTQPVPGSTVFPYFIVDGVYRNATTVSRTDYTGATYTSIEPDMGTHVSSAPYVPPRVTVEGTAGKYVINEIIRGMSGGDDAFMRGSLLINTRKAGVQSLTNGQSNLVINQQEFSWYQQGWVGNTGFNFANGSQTAKSQTIEVELTYGDSYAKYLLSTKHVRTADWGKWMVVAPQYETYAPRNSTLTTDQVKNVLLAQVDTGGNLHLYVASTSGTSQNFITASDLFLNGMVVVRSLQGPLLSATGISMPAISLTGFTKYVWGYTNTSGSQVDASQQLHGRPVYRGQLSQDILNLKNAITYGLVKCSVVSSVYYLTFDKISLYTARSVFRSSGQYDIVMPAVGTVVPVTTNGLVVDSSTTTANGFAFNGISALYYVLPVGASTGSTSLDANFVFVNPSADFDIPEHWILIAARINITPGAAFQLGNGREVDNWKTITPPTGWVQSTDHPLEYRRENGRVFFRGGFAANGSKASGTSLSALIPAGYRPGLYTFGLGIYGSTPGRLDFDTAGAMGVRVAMADGASVYLDNVSFTAEN